MTRPTHTPELVDDDYLDDDYGELLPANFGRWLLAGAVVLVGIVFAVVLVILSHDPAAVP